MPLRLEIKKEISAKSERVKCVDIHSSDHPWVLSALYNGKVYIWDYSSNTLVKSFELCDVPVRCAKFITRKQWFIAGTDDLLLRVYNYNTMEKIKEWEGHTDYIRYLEIHPNRPYVLSSSDDMSIKLWDWEKDFECIQIFEGHAHYVMMVKINPRDTNIFASASLDRTIKVWGLTAGTPHFSLEAHEKGVNCIDYYPGGDKPYLLSGADDKTVKIWDYQTKACLQTLDGHSHNVTAVCFHPRLPLIVSASEDGTIRLWHSTTYRPESTLNYGMERAWTLAPTGDANKLAIGYDEGTVVIKLGNEKPVASLDTNTGKLVWARNHDIQTSSLKGLAKDNEIVDGEKISMNIRDLGACEVYPQTLMHNCNGSFIVICGDGEWIIYTSQALRNKAFGQGLDFVWSASGTGDYAVRESISRVRIFKNFKEHKQVSLPMSSADGLFGGQCLSVKGSDCIIFFDWEEGDFIRKIDVSPSQVFWNEAGDAVLLACADNYFVLKYDRDAVANALASGNVNPEEGVDGSFELESTITDRIRTGQWVGDCFLYTNGSGKLNYYVGGEVITLCHLERPMYLLGFVPKEDRVFLIDKSYNVISYKLLLSMLSYQTAVVRKDFDSANALLPSIPKSEYAAAARFLESQGYKEEALLVTTDLDHKFELSIDLRKIDIAQSVLLELSEQNKGEEDSVDMQNKWRHLGDLALANGNIALSEQCADRSADLSGLLLLYSASANKNGMLNLAKKAKESGRYNVAFIAYFTVGLIEECIQLLLDTGRIPEACFMARTYMPSMIPATLEMWKNDLKSVNENASNALADPAKYPNLFPDLDWALKVEEMFKVQRSSHVPATSYPLAKGELDLNLIEIFKSQAAAAASPSVSKAAPVNIQSSPVAAPSVSETAPVNVKSSPLPSPKASPTTSPSASPVKELSTIASIPEQTNNDIINDDEDVVDVVADKEDDDVDKLIESVKLDDNTDALDDLDDDLDSKW